MGSLLAGLPVEVPGVTVNRLCASGLEAISQAARSIKTGDGDIVLAGGVESMTRSPFVMLKPDRAFPRGARELVDTTIGWRFVNPRMDENYSTESMGETAENVAARYGVSREDQDAFALESHRRAIAAHEAGKFDEEIVTVDAPQPKGAAGDRPLRRGAAPGHDTREAREAPPGVPRGRHRHRRQLVPDQRRRRLPRAGLRRGAEAAGRPRAARAGRLGRAPPASTPPTWASALCRRCARRSTRAGSGRTTSTWSS